MPYKIYYEYPQKFGNSEMYPALRAPTPFTRDAAVFSMINVPSIPLRIRRVPNHLFRAHRALYRPLHDMEIVIDIGGIQRPEVLTEPFVCRVQRQGSRHVAQVRIVKLAFGQRALLPPRPRKRVPVPLLAELGAHMRWTKAHGAPCAVENTGRDWVSRLSTVAVHGRPADGEVDHDEVGSVVEKFRHVCGVHYFARGSGALRP